MAGEIDMGQLQERVIRRLGWARWLRWSLLLLVGITLAFVIARPIEHTPWVGLGILTAVLLAWLPSLARSRQQRQLIAFGTQLLAQGRLQDAELSLTHVLERFSLATGPQLVGCHYMAVVAHARHQFAEAVDWCRAVLRYAQRSARIMLRSSRVLLADCLISLDQLEEAYQALQPLYDQPLSLTEQLMLLPVQLRYEVAADHFDSALSDLGQRVQLAGLLDTRQSAKAHALLMVACRKTGRHDEAVFLWQRVEALGEDSVIREYATKTEDVCPQSKCGS